MYYIHIWISSAFQSASGGEQRGAEYLHERKTDRSRRQEISIRNAAWHCLPSATTFPLLAHPRHRRCSELPQLLLK